MPVVLRVGPTPKQSQTYYMPGVGISVMPTSVPRKEIQKTSGAASDSNSLVAAGLGSIAIQPGTFAAAGGTYSFNLNLNLPSPMTAQTPLSMVVAAPQLQLGPLDSITITSFSAQPLILLPGSTLPTSGLVISRGTSIRQFIAAIALTWSAASITNPAFATCQATLVTTAG